MSKRKIALLVACGLLLAGIISSGVGFMIGGKLTNVYIDKNGLQFGYYNPSYTDNTLGLFEENMENFGKNMADKLNSNLGTNHVSDSSKGDYNKVLSEVASFKNIDVSSRSSRIELVKFDRNAIEYNLPMGETVEICVVLNDTLTFRTSSTFGITLFGVNSSYIRVYYKDDSKLDTVKVKSTSGSINIDGLTANDLYVEATSGSRNLTNITANKVDVSGFTGSLKMGGVTANSIFAKSTSGSSTLEDCISTSLQVASASGGVKLHRVKTSSLEAKTLSGSVYVQGELKGMSKIASTSGSVKVHTSLEKDSYGYKLFSNSGSCKVDDENFEGTNGQDKPDFIEATTTSGSVKVFFNSNG